MTIGFTLCVSIASWLEAVEWNKDSGALTIGSEVTVYGEKSGEKVNHNSFWATGMKVSDAKNALYEVNSMMLVTLLTELTYGIRNDTALHPVM